MYVLKELVTRLSITDIGMAKVADMYVAFTQMGKRDELDAILAEVLANKPTEQREVEQPHQEETVEHNSDNGLQAGNFRILEARETNSGAVRAYCQARDGSKVAVFGKNGVGKALTANIGKGVKIEYRQGDKGLIAIKVA